MPLRDYQLKVENDITKSFLSGHRAPCVVMPTGSGKGDVAVDMAAKCVAKGKRCLFIVHRGPIVDQIRKRAEFAGISTGVLSASATGTYADQPFICATVQTMLARETYPAADLCIVDEAHRFPTETFGPAVRRYSHVVGFTATPERDTGAGLGDIFDDLVIGPSIVDLVSRGFLVPSEVLAPSRILGPGEIAQTPVDAWLKNARGERTVVFAPHVKAARLYTEQFQDAGIRAALITGSSSYDARQRAFLDLKDGDISVVVNCGVLTEGWDEPSITCVIIARGCGSCGLYLQIVGRCLRPYPGKTRALVLDLRGVTHVHGAPDAEREYSLEGIGIRRAGDGLRFCPICSQPIPLNAVDCPTCEWARKEMKDQVVVGVDLEKYAFKRRETDEERGATLARWLMAGRAKGHRDAAAYIKYKAVYGAEPNGNVIRASRAHLQST